MRRDADDDGGSVVVLNHSGMSRSVERERGYIHIAVEVVIVVVVVVPQVVVFGSCSVEGASVGANRLPLLFLSWGVMLVEGSGVVKGDCEEKGILKIENSSHVDGLQLALGWHQCFAEPAFHVLSKGYNTHTRLHEHVRA